MVGPDDDVLESGSEVRICDQCGHPEDDHRPDDAALDRVAICVICDDRHRFVARVEIGER
jgi:hypothetical protein